MPHGSVSEDHVSTVLIAQSTWPPEGDPEAEALTLGGVTVGVLGLHIHPRPEEEANHVLTKMNVHGSSAIEQYGMSGASATLKSSPELRFDA
jgi:hypothetical protein